MDIRILTQKARRLANCFRIKKGEKFKLSNIDPKQTLDFSEKDKPDIKKILLPDSIKRLSLMQEKLYAQNQKSVLIIFQGMDTAGKDSTIEHVMSGISPLGCTVYPFKAPSDEELDHDFLWRCNSKLPNRGDINIFNRSYYEEVLVARVHPEILEKQRLPKKLVTPNIWGQRFEDINNFEKHLARNGTTVIKIFLHVSKEEQKERLLRRLDDPNKNWKFSKRDLEERKLWDKYMEFHEKMVRNTSTPSSPWYIVPADNKWFARLAVSSILVKRLEEMKLDFPEMSDVQKEELIQFEESLRNEK